MKGKGLEHLITIIIIMVAITIAVVFAVNFYHSYLINTGNVTNEQLNKTKKGFMDIWKMIFGSGNEEKKGSCSINLDRDTDLINVEIPVRVSYKGVEAERAKLMCGKDIKEIICSNKICEGNCSFSFTGKYEISAEIDGIKCSRYINIEENPFER